MGKARKLRKLPEDSNLNRFKNYVNQFSQENVGQFSDHDHNLGVRKDLSRKDRRKAERKLHKMKKHAFKTRNPIPTKDSIENERKLKEEEIQKQKQKEKQERKKKQKKKKKKRRQEMKKEEKEAKKKTLYEANKYEDKEIKKYEKLLRLNKRKSKTISLGFRNDGLDFLLEAVDKDKLKELMETGEELESAEMALGIDEDSGSDQPDDDSDNFFEDDNDDMQIGSAEESLVDGDEDYESESDNDKVIKNESKSKLIDGIMNSLLSDKNSKACKKKSVTFSDNIEVSDSIKKACNTERTDEMVVAVLSKKDKKKSSLKQQTQQFENTDSVVNDGSSDGSIHGKEGNDEESDESEIEDSGNEEELIDKDSEDDTGDEDLEEFKDSDKESDLHSENDDSGYTEDIYGRLRDKAGNIIDPKTLGSKKSQDNTTGGAYIPPGKRLAMAKDMDEKKRIQIERMKKQLKGLINRVSEGNMQSVANQIEETFRNHSRAETCEALTEIIMGASINSFLVPERLMMEHCMLIAILHGNVGTEIGAHFLQYFAQRFKTMFENRNYHNGKEMDNLVMFLSNLYNFKVVHSLLLFDVMKKFAERFGERDIEVLLVILKNVGFSLRKDDPVALKEFIVQIQSKANTVDTDQFEEKSKVQFMLEIILHIKNNNMRKIPNYDPSHLDHLRKLLRNFIRGSTSSDSQLRISLEDLLLAEEQGKWWIVGSAWTGRELTTNTSTTDHSAGLTATGEVSEKILELARKQRMNTDVRKNIFCIIMTSEDFVDAFEKLLRLGLKQQPEREIIHVIVDLCLQEKKFNPFYAYLMQKFCEYDRRFQMTLQFNIWDKFKETSNLGDQRIHNLCKLLTHLIATQAMSLSLFKVLEFSELDKYRVRLMKTTLSSILLDYDEHITKETFTRIAPLAKLQTLREGLKLFMKHFLLKKPKKKDSNFDEDRFEFLTQRVEIAEKALNSGESQFRM